MLKSQADVPSIYFYRSRNHDASRFRKRGIFGSCTPAAPPAPGRRLPPPYHGQGVVLHRPARRRREVPAALIGHSTTPTSTIILHTTGGGRQGIRDCGTGRSAGRRSGWTKTPPRCPRHRLNTLAIRHPPPPQAVSGNRNGSRHSASEKRTWMGPKVQGPNTAPSRDSVVGGRRHGGQGQLLRVFVFHVVPPHVLL